MCEIIAHSKEHELKPPFKCEKLYLGKVCGEVFSEFTSFFEHSKTVHCNSDTKPIHRKEPIIRDKSGKLKCPECDKQYEVLSLLDDHRDVVHRMDRYVCDWNDCQYSTDQRFLLVIHKKRHLGIKSVHCSWPGCDYTCVGRSDLYSHSKRHLNEKHCCTQCDQTFKNRSYLNNHVLVVHAKDRPFECEECKKKYATETSLNAHNRMVHSGTQFKCDRCDYKSYRKTRLDQHIRRIHLREKTYRCDVKGCEGKSFFAKNGLLAHQTSAHSDERKFVCDWPECGAQFKLKSNLYVHVKCHTGENKPRKRKKPI